MGTVGNATSREPWDKGKIVREKAPFKLKDIWALRVRLQMEDRVHELALFNLGIKLRGCDLVALKAPQTTCPPRRSVRRRRRPPPWTGLRQTPLPIASRPHASG